MNYNDKTKRILIISFLFGIGYTGGWKAFFFSIKNSSKKYPELHILTLKEKYIPQKDNFLVSVGIVHRAGMYPPFPI